jgi:hypothetical protein
MRTGARRCASCSTVDGRVDPGSVVRAAILAAAILLAPHARAEDPVDKCVADHEQGQLDARAGRYRAARERFTACTTDACPALVRKACVELAREIDSVQPSLVVRARDFDGGETAEVAVIMDGKRIADRLTGMSLPVDTGERLFRFESPDGLVIERRLVIGEGDTRRVVEVDFSALGRRPMPTPPGAYVTGALAVLGVAGFAGFGIHGLVREGELEACAPFCPTSDVNVVRRDYAAAYTSLGVAVVASALTVYYAWPRLSPDPRRRVRVAASATAIRIEGCF